VRRTALSEAVLAAAVQLMEARPTQDDVEAENAGRLPLWGRDMGAWGTGSFENDDAAGFVVRLEDEGKAAIHVALENVIGRSGGDYLEAPEASSAVAASEVVAAARDGDVSRLPETAQDWLARHADGLATPSLLALAHGAVQRVFTQSELKDLWEEGDADAQAEEWATGIRQLIARLEATPSSSKAEPPKRRKSKKAIFEPGVLLRVDLDDRWHSYARMLARSPNFAFYDCRVSTPPVDVLSIVSRPVLFVLAVNERASSGHWLKIGQVPLEMAPVPIPNRFMQDIGTDACQIVDEAFNTRSATPEECVGLERVAVWDPEHVEERLRDHYAGRPNAHLTYMKVRLPPSG
jgi:Domain of unknown function (DUF4259)